MHVFPLTSGFELAEAEPSADPTAPVKGHGTPLNLVHQKLALKKKKKLSAIHSETQR